MKSRIRILAIAGAVAVAAAAAGTISAAETKHGEHGAAQNADVASKAHRATGVVKKIDRPAGTVTLAHEAVKSLSWPAMVMAFKVQDPGLYEKLGEGRKVEFQFEQRGKDYVITGAK